MFPIAVEVTLPEEKIRLWRRPRKRARGAEDVAAALERAVAAGGAPDAGDDNCGSGDGDGDGARGGEGDGEGECEGGGDANGGRRRSRRECREGRRTPLRGACYTRCTARPSCALAAAMRRI